MKKLAQLYLFKLLKILSIQFIIDFRDKCSVHLVYPSPINTIKPWMNLKNGKAKRSFLAISLSKKLKDLNLDTPDNTLISSAPFAPSLWLTLHKSLLMRSFASIDNFASSGNFKCVLQFTICIKQSTEE